MWEILPQRLGTRIPQSKVFTSLITTARYSSPPPPPSFCLLKYIPNIFIFVLRICQNINNVIHRSARIYFECNSTEIGSPVFEVGSFPFSLSPSLSPPPLYFPFHLIKNMQHVTTCGQYHFSWTTKYACFQMLRTPKGTRGDKNKRRWIFPERHSR